MENKGIHYILDAEDCNTDKLLNSSLVIEELKKLILKNNLTPIAEVSYQFTNDKEEQEGFSAVIILQESHLGFNIHTWPGNQFKNSVQIDLFVCNYLTDNTLKAASLFNDIIEFFEIKDFTLKEILR